MKSDQIFDVITSIAATSSKKEKEALVAANINDSDFRRVIVAALDPMVKYGIRKHPGTVGEHSVNEFDEGTFELLQQLASRELTGNAAIEALRGELTALTDKSAELLWRIVSKDFRAGFEISTVNKACKGLLPEYPYMRCSLPKHIKDLNEFFADGAIVQEKADGSYTNVDHLEDGSVRLTTRQGTEYNLEAFGDFIADVRNTFLPGTQTQGELVVLRDTGTLDEAGNTVYDILPRKDGNGILNSVQDGGSFPENHIPLFLAWDQLPLEVVKPKGVYKVPYTNRLGWLAEQIKKSGVHIDLIETEFVENMEQAWAFYRKKLKEGKEGAIVKKKAAIWKDGTSLEQIKLKLKAPFEARVKGFNYGTGKNEGKVSSLQCASECGLVEFDLTCRGDKMIAEITANPDSWLDAIVTAEGNAIMDPSESNPKHSIYLPIFVERRTDRSAADDLQRIRDQFQAAMEAA